MFLHPVRWPFLCLLQKDVSSANVWFGPEQKKNVGLSPLSITVPREGEIVPCGFTLLSGNNCNYFFVRNHINAQPLIIFPVRVHFGSYLENVFVCLFFLFRDMFSFRFVFLRFPFILFVSLSFLFFSLLTTAVYQV